MVRRLASLLFALMLISSYGFAQPSSVGAVSCSNKNYLFEYGDFQSYQTLITFHARQVLSGGLCRASFLSVDFTVTYGLNQHAGPIYYTCPSSRCGWYNDTRGHYWANVTFTPPGDFTKKWYPRMEATTSGTYSCRDGGGGTPGFIWCGVT
jgi:hypothetical protein